MENRRMASQRHTESLKQLADLLSRKTDAEELSETQGMLLGVKKALDNGRYVGAKKDGVERVLKASWHADGSWPLIGRDEASRHAICDPEACIIGALHISKHPHSAVVPCRPYEHGKAAGQILPCQHGVREPANVGPSAVEIAAAYAARRGPA